MTYEEMTATVNALLAAGEAAAVRAEKVLHKVPFDDAIVGELCEKFNSAADDLQAIKRKGMRSGDFNEIIAAAARVRDAGNAWVRYVEAVAKAPEKSIPGCMEAIFARLHQKGLIIDTGERRWSPKKKRDDIVWTIAPNVPPDCDAGSDEDNKVLNFLRGRSPAD